MSFKKGFGKPARPPPPKQGTGLSLSGFSFKQLEEDEDDEDLTAFTGKYEKIVEESQKAQRKSHERTPSASSVPSVSSAPGEIKTAEKSRAEVVGDTSKPPLKPAASLPLDSTSSPIKNAARAKLETSKELFSGLKGRITDKISKTIEEFSDHSSSSPSPEKEKPKSLSFQQSNSFGPVEKENVSILRSSAPVTEHLGSFSSTAEASVKEKKERSFSAPAKDIEPSASLIKASSSSSLKETQSSSPAKKEKVPSATVEAPASLHSSGFVEEHPLAKTDDSDVFEDVIETSEIDSSQKSKSGDDISDSPDVHNGVNEADILMFEEHFTSEPPEDFTGHQGFSTSTQLVGRSKIKRLMKKKEPKTSAVATMSGLHDTPDEEIIASSNVKSSKSSKGETNNTSDINSQSTPVSSESTPSVVLRQFNLENRSMPTMPYQKLISVTILLFAYLIVPLPSYLSGLIMGILMASLGWSIYMWLMEPAPPPEPFVLPPLEEPLPVPVMKITTESEEFLYKGWLNELTDYNSEDYHINKTHSVFISLEGCHLRMQRPKNAIPKRAMWDEVLPKAQFIHQRHFDLPGSSVFLLPHGLVKKRIWSKKYPICIALASSANQDLKLKHVPSEPIMAGKKEKLSDMGFEFVTEEKCESNVLYLFARTGREKEEWFRRFTAAALGKPLGNHVLDMKRIVTQSSTSTSATTTVQKKNSESSMRHKREGSTDSVCSSSSTISDTQSESVSEPKEKEGVDLLTFSHYMGRLMPSGFLSQASSPTHSSSNKDITKSVSVKEGIKSSGNKESEEARVVNPSGPIICDSQLFWVNALIGRCFFDFLRDQWWIEKVTEKLQRKLSKIHVPYFIEELQVTDILMGYEIPSIRRAGKPFIDERGFWVDLDITYSGGFQMTIKTKMNLMKLKKAQSASAHAGHSVDKTKSPITDSEEEDSAESSTDEEEEAPANSDESSSGGGASKKLLRYLNKITQSKYFQQATEYKVIKRAMENVSNTPLTLTVTVNSLVGKLALNIPPPPSDRLWYGFRGNPHLRLSAKPQVGERAVTITHVTEWIEKKLAIEFQRVFVMPNMDDLIIPILAPGEINGTTISRSVSL